MTLRFSSPEEEKELNALLRRLSPGIADLMLRMMQTAAQTWEEAKSYRDEIVELNRIAQTDEDQGVLLFGPFGSLSPPELAALIAGRMRG